MNATASIAPVNDDVRRLPAPRLRPYEFAHLTRERRSITGTTPAAWMVDEDHLRDGAELALES